MLTADQMENIQNAKTDIENKKLIFNTAIDIQALLRLLVEKEIISKKEINRFREEVRNSPKYRNSITYVEQTLEEIKYYENDPQALLKAIMKQKLNL